MKTTIILTVFNEEKTIRDLIDSILAQTQLPDEIIIVDGGSGDGTVSSIKYKVSSIKRPEFKIFVKKGNRSIGRNEAIKRSSAEIIAITDAGCILDKNWFKNVTKPFENDSTDVVAGYYKAKPKNIFQKCLVPYVFVMPDRVDPSNFLPATRSMAIRKSVWKKIGGFDEKLSNNEDYAFARKIKENGAKIVFQKSAIVFWIPRTNLKQAFVMFYRFAKGDIEAGIFRPKVALVFLRYFAALYLLFTNNYLLLTLFALGYLLWSILKNYKYVKKKEAFFLLPIIQLTADASVLCGSFVVLVVRFFPFVSLLLFIILILRGINLPYVGQNAYNFITYSLIAHNYNQFGYLTTKLASVVSVSADFPRNPEYFMHHPPLLSIVESLFLRFLGEDFWVGRLVAVIFTGGVVGLLYLIERELSDKKQALVTLGVALLIPATGIFGQMIGQEPLVMFFTLASLFLSLRYFKSEKNPYFYGAIICSILAVLSDWPAIYFCLFLIPLFIKNKKTKEGLILFGVSIFACTSILLWISNIRHGLWDIKNAAGSRFIAQLFSIPYWPVRFLSSAFLRFLIYFNPIFTFTTFIVAISILRKIKKLSQRELVILILGFFGLFHLVLYAEASFTHPYLIIYLIPFISFASAGIMENLAKKKLYLISSIIITFSILFIFLISQLKEEQITSNIWRYDLALSATQYLTNYDTVIFNDNYAIDAEIWKYPLLINPIRQDKYNSSKFLSKYSYYVYSCEPTCSVYGGQMASLTGRYQYIIFRTDNAEAYLFFLKKPQITFPPKALKISKVKPAYASKSELIDVYRKIRDLLNVPQI